MKKIISVLITTFLLTSLALADSNSEAYSNSEQARANCSGQISGAKDYLDPSEQEVQLLGKETFHANIAMVEKALKERGVPLPENGFITSDLRKALIAFQESVGLPAKGEINQETLDKLGVKF